MSIRIGIYDFFAYTIPGGFYLLTIAYLCLISGLATIDFQSLSNPSIVQAIVVAILAYIAGLVFDPIAQPWYRLFKPKSFSKKVLDEFKESYTDLEIKFQARDWPVLLAYLRRENIDIAADIEKLNATNIMLRNASFNLVILSVIQIIQYIRTGFFAWNLVLCFVFLISSIIAGRESIKRVTWFYLGIYEAITARSLELSDLLVRKQEVASRDTERSSEE